MENENSNQADTDVAATSADSYLRFEVGTHHYGIHTSGVREIIALPDIVPVDETPAYVTGMLNLRGQIIPVIDLTRLFEHTPQSYTLSDRTIVLQHDNALIGIIVNHVHEVESLTLSNEDMSATELLGQHSLTHLITGLARYDHGIVMLLDCGLLFQQMEPVKKQIPLLEPAGMTATVAETAFFAEAGDEERTVLEARSEALLQPIEELDLSGHKPLAVVTINGEFFGVTLDEVREFSEVRQVSPVPCTPEHILGNMNLRGEVLTLIDIRPVLQMSRSEQITGGKVIVAVKGEITAGIHVDEVVDVLYATLDEIESPPMAVVPICDDMLRGTISFDGRVVTVIDLGHVLENESIIVNEAV